MNTRSKHNMSTRSKQKMIDNKREESASKKQKTSKKNDLNESKNESELVPVAAPVATVSRLSDSDENSLLDKMVAMRPFFMGSKSYNPRGEYYAGWLESEGEKFKIKINKFNINFQKVLGEHTASMAFEEALSIEDIKSPGYDRAVFSHFFYEYPAVARFLHHQLIESDALEDVINALQKFTAEMKPEKSQHPEELTDIEKFRVIHEAHEKLAKSKKEESKQVSTDVPDPKITLMRRQKGSDVFSAVVIENLNQYNEVYEKFRKEGLVVNPNSEEPILKIPRGKVISTILGRLNLHAEIQAKKNAVAEPVSACDPNDVPRQQQDQPSPR